MDHETAITTPRARGRCRLCWQPIYRRWWEGHGNDFVVYLDAIGELDGNGCLLEWKTYNRALSERTHRVAAS